MTETLPKPNKPNPVAVLLLLFLTPVLLPFYALGALCALIQVTAFWGYKDIEEYFMRSLGYETHEQIIARIIKDIINDRNA